MRAMDDGGSGAHAAPRRRLRVAMVTETYPPEINGVAVTMAHLVSGLCRRGHEIQIVRPRQMRNETPARRPGCEEVLVPGVPIPRYDALKLGLPAKRTLRALWSRERPDIVHVVTEGPLGGSALTAARELGLPVSTDFHTNFHAYTGHYGVGWLKKPVTAYLRRFHNRALCTMVPTPGLREELAALGFENLAIVARGVDTRLFSPARRSAALREAWGAAPADVVALSVGRVAPEKNLPLVMETYEAMRRARPGTRLVVVGDGPVRRRLQSSHPLPIFAGMRTGEDLAAHYASADVFLFPSVTETYGNVTIEALASGLAVVAYDHAAAAVHIRSGENGLTAPFGDRARFIRLAVDLLDRPAEIVRLGSSARTTAESIDWADVVSEFEDALTHLATGRAARGI